MASPPLSPPLWPPNQEPPTPASPLTDPRLAALHRALTPLRPFLRSEQYLTELWAERDDPQPQARAVLAIGPHADDLSIVVRPGVVFVDLPIGDVPQQGPALATLLHLNTFRTWKFRLDSVHDGQALIVLEAQVDTDDLSRLPGLVMEALMERTLLQATLHALRERTHA